MFALENKFGLLLLVIAPSLKQCVVVFAVVVAVCFYVGLCDVSTYLYHVLNYKLPL